MGQAVGNSITLAVGVAISPIPVIAIILMLLSKRAGVNSFAFGLGWVIGIAGALTVVIVASASIGTGTNGTQSNGTSTTKVILGALLLLLALRNWRKRPAPGQPATLPKWLEAIEGISPIKAGGLGIALSALNPKNLILIIGGGLAIAGAPASSGNKVIAAIIFVAIAACTVIAPIVAYRILGQRAQSVLESLDTWLRTNNAVVMAVLLGVIGVDLIGKGVGGF